MNFIAWIAVYGAELSFLVAIASFFGCFQHPP